MSCEEVIECYSDMVYRIAISHVSNKNVADDIFQDVFLQLVRHLDRLESETHIKYWLIRTTINRCKNHFKSPWNKRITEFSEQEISGKDMLPSDIYFMVQALPSNLKNVIYLYYYEKYNISEIAEIMKIKEGTVKSRLYKARNVLKSQIKGEIENEL